MDILFSPERDTPSIESGASSAASLLEQGLNCVQQGHYAEGIAFFSLARERLSSNQMHIAPVLDALIQDYVSYWQAQQVLLQASRRLVDAHSKQQTRITVLENLLPNLAGNTDNALHTVTLSLQNSQDHQLLQSPQPLSRDTRGYQSLSSPPGIPLQDTLLENVSSPSSRASHPAQVSEALPALHFTCFGRFEVKRLGRTISLCSNRNGQAILRYLVAQSCHRATMDTLMALLWPEDEPEIAHHKLQVAISALRRSLNSGYTNDPGGGYILCKHGVYQLNPAVPLRSDVDEFLACYQTGQQSRGCAVVEQYEAACRLYTGPFLLEDLYADWSLIQREQLRQAYLAMCGALAEYYLEVSRYEDAAQWATAILKENRCDEAAHQLLIRIYVAEGRRSEALQQYQRCERIVAEELGMPLMPETVHLFHTVLNSAILPNDRTKIEPG